MAKTHIGKAALTYVRAAGNGVTGATILVYKGDVVPGNADKADIKRLVDEGFLVEFGDDALPVQGGDQIVDELIALGDASLLTPAGTVPEVQVDVTVKPSKSASKEAWLAYSTGPAGGKAEADVAGLTRDEIAALYADPA